MSFLQPRLFAALPRPRSGTHTRPPSKTPTSAQFAADALPNATRQEIAASSSFCPSRSGDHHAIASTRAPEVPVDWFAVLPQRHPHLGSKRSLVQIHSCSPREEIGRVRTPLNSRLIKISGAELQTGLLAARFQTCLVIRPQLNVTAKASTPADCATAKDAVPREGRNHQLVPPVCMGNDRHHAHWNKDSGSGELPATARTQRDGMLISPNPSEDRRLVTTMLTATQSGTNARTYLQETPTLSPTRTPRFLTQRTLAADPMLNAMLRELTRMRERLMPPRLRHPDFTERDVVALKTHEPGTEPWVPTREGRSPRHADIIPLGDDPPDSSFNRGDGSNNFAPPITARPEVER